MNESTKVLSGSGGGGGGGGDSNINDDDDDGGCSGSFIVAIINICTVFIDVWEKDFLVVVGKCSLRKHCILLNAKDGMI